MSKPALIWRVVRAALFLFLGLGLGLFTPEAQEGTWIQYLGYGLIILGVMDSMMLIPMVDKQEGNLFTWMLKWMAFLFPFSFIFYGPLHDNPRHPMHKVLWVYMVAGVTAYILVAVSVIGV